MKQVVAKNTSVKIMIILLFSISFSLRAINAEAVEDIRLIQGIWVFENDPSSYSIEQGQWLDAQFTAKNFGNQPVTLNKIGIGGRAPDYDGGGWSLSAVYDMGFDENITLAPGEERQFWFHKELFGSDKPWGTYRLYAVYHRSSDDSWIEIPPGNAMTGTSKEFNIIPHSNPQTLSFDTPANEYVPRGGYDGFYINVPIDAIELKIEITGAKQGNYINLYEQSGTNFPSNSSFDHAAETGTSNETIAINNPSAGWHTILVDGFYDGNAPERGTPYAIKVTYQTQSADITKPWGDITGIKSSYDTGDEIAFTVIGEDNQELASLYFAITDSGDNKKYERTWSANGKYHSESDTIQETQTSNWAEGTYYYALWVNDEAGNNKEYTGSFVLSDPQANQDQIDPTGEISGIKSSYDTGDEISFTVIGEDNQELASLYFAITDNGNNRKYEKTWSASGKYHSESDTIQGTQTSNWTEGTYYYALWVNDEAGNNKEYTGSFVLSDPQANQDQIDPTGEISGIKSSYDTGDEISFTVIGEDNQELASLYFAITDNGNNRKYEKTWSASGKYHSESDTIQETQTSNWTEGTYYYALWVNDEAGNNKEYTGSFQLTKSPQVYSHSLIRTSIGNMVGKEVIWRVEPALPSTEQVKLVLRNLRYDESDNKHKKELAAGDLNFSLSNNKVKYTFENTNEKAGIYAVSLQKEDGTAITPEILQIMAPDPEQITEKPSYVDTTDLDNKFKGFFCDEKITYDVIVVGGTSAGVGAAVTAAREGLSVCLLERTDLLGGMLTNGIGVTDAGLDKFDQKKKLSHGMIEELRSKVVQVYKEEGQTEELGRIKDSKYDCEGLKFRPSIVRKALYKLINEAQGNNNNNPRIQLNAPFKGITYTDKDNVRTFSITTEDNEKPFKSYYIIDATDSGDVAYEYAKYAKVLNEVNEYDVYKIRRPTQAYSYIMTLQDHRNDENDENWSLMKTSPPGYGDEGEYTDVPFFGKKLDSYGNLADKRTWTYTRGWLTANSWCEEDAADENKCIYDFKNNNYRIFQVKHHSGLGIQTSDTQGRKGCVRRGDELVDKGINIGNKTVYYPELEEQKRYKIRERYINHTIGLLFKMQNQADSGFQGDEYNATKNKFIGLTTYEDPLRGNFPARMYIREGRRICGKLTFEKEDAFKKEEYDRPANNTIKSKQSIGVVTYTMDSHGTDDCKSPEGNFTDNRNHTGPGVIPLGILIPSNSKMTNILVASAVSSTPEGYSTLRMEPTRMIMGQAAALAIKVAKEDDVNVNQIIDNDIKDVIFKMQQRLISNYGGRIFLFNDEGLFSNLGNYNELENYLQSQEEKGIGIYESIKDIRELDDNNPIKKEWQWFNELNMATQFLGIWKIAQGKDEYKFKLWDPITRAEFIKMVIEARMSLDPEERNYFDVIYNPLEYSFSDIQNHWAKKYIKYAKDKNIVNGYKDSMNFGPDDNISRAAIAKIITYALFSKEYAKLLDEDNLKADNDFNDISKSDWYYPFVGYVYENGIMKGYTNEGSFKPKQVATRGEAALSVFRALCIKKTGQLCK